MAGNSANPFWDFSLALYREPGVPEAAIALQDEAGADVNLLFYLLWLAARGRRLDPAGIAAVEARVAAWCDAVVRPLRGVRRWLKVHEFAGTEQQALRGAVKRLELEAERLQQRELAALPLPGTPDDGPFAGRANAMLDDYAARLGQRFEPPRAAVLVAAAMRVASGAAGR